eukprot:Phypoly_transcript_14106.p1 GENE.Phypoly_transcript_14106~~Phypoly_transcript_14106.p1  ORF type:complete len:318 (+),score=17.87 Phypoly_transcript_14106:40-954(+)
MDDYATATGSVSLFSAFICGFAVTTSYIFPQQRKFPNVVLLWTCINDFVLAIYMAILCLPTPVRDMFVAQIEFDPVLCTFSLYSFWLLQESASMLSLLLICTLYITIVKHVNLEENKAYYCAYLAIFWIPTILLPCFCLIEAVHMVRTGACIFSSKVGTVIRAANWFILFLIQLILIIKVFKVVNSITHAIESHATNGINKAAKVRFWLRVRCFGGMVNQVVIWTPATITQLMSAWNKSVGDDLVIFSVIAPVFLSINGFIVLAGNKPLRTALSCIFPGSPKGQNPREMIRVSSFYQPNEINGV